jgi:predicted Zn-dependent protease
LLAVGCTTVPVTERSQLNLIPRDQILSLSFEQHRRFLNENRVVVGTAQSAMVKRVGVRIQQAVESYLQHRGPADILQGYEWEFNLIKDDRVNAFAMPGGKVVILTGILPVARNDSGLATVMGHEIGHAIARHGNERMSQSLLAQLGGTALAAGLNDRPDETRRMFMAAYGLGAQVGVLLPYNRLQESEADELGLIFMAVAGYDPREAIDFWQRMDQQAAGGGTPEFLSTHPSHATRISELRRHMQEALAYYRH